MSALDQSLDEILKNKPRKQLKKKPVAGRTKVVKAVGKPKASAAKKPVVFPSGRASSTVLDASYATKVVVYGLWCTESSKGRFQLINREILLTQLKPKDIKQDAIKDFFASEIGGVQSVGLSYNEKGQSKGIATIIFRSSVNASKAVQKYNGAPIDNGAGKLKLELIIDPTKKPLSTRIVANALSKTKPKLAEKAGPKKANASKPKVGVKTNGKTNGKAKPKAKKPAKKTVEELDQEMSDYFEKKE